MVAAIAHILKENIGTLPWIRRYGSLVVPVTKPKVLHDAKSGDLKVGADQVYPLSCDANFERCWETGTYKHFEPSDDMESIAFFMDGGGCVLKSVEGPKRQNYIFTFNLKFLCWMNVRKLGFEDCQVTALAVPNVITKLIGTHSAAGTAYEGYRNIEVTNIREMEKNPSMFMPFTFATEGNRRGIFLFPYDYFGLQITGTFMLCKSSPPEFVGPDFEFVDANCKPA